MAQENDLHGSIRGKKTFPVQAAKPMTTKTKATFRFEAEQGAHISRRGPISQPVPVLADTEALPRGIHAKYRNSEAQESTSHNSRIEWQSGTPGAGWEIQFVSAWRKRIHGWREPETCTEFFVPPKAGILRTVPKMAALTLFAGGHCIQFAHSRLSRQLSGCTQRGIDPKSQEHRRAVERDGLKLLEKKADGYECGSVVNRRSSARPVSIQFRDRRRCLAGSSTTQTCVATKEPRTSSEGPQLEACHIQFAALPPLGIAQRTRRSWSGGKPAGSRVGSLKIGMTPNGSIRFASMGRKARHGLSPNVAGMRLPNWMDTDYVEFHHSVLAFL